jgi:hypothetical protein
MALTQGFERNQDQQANPTALGEIAMAESEATTPALTAKDCPSVGRFDWKFSLLLGSGLFAIYFVNFRVVGTVDTLGAALLSVCIIRGDGPFLDRFLDAGDAPEGKLLYWSCTKTRGHVMPCYPVGPGLLAVPFTLPQVVVLDLFVPGWEAQGVQWCQVMSKNTAAAVAALVAVTLFDLLRVLGFRRVALPTVLAAALGSNLWTTASQSMWQHGPAALALSLSILLLTPPKPSRLRLCLAGLTTAALVSFRAIDIVFAAVVFLWIVRHRSRGLVWFLPPVILAGTALLGYNCWYFGAIEGGQVLIEASHPKLHGFVGSWSGNLLEGAAGTLLSPSRGLFIFTPWVAVAVAAAPITAKRLKSCSLIPWLLWAVVPYFLLLSKYGCWWGGHCFGPRFWTDTVPLFAILLAAGLDWSLARCRMLFGTFVVAITLSVAVQVVGAFCYPSSWNDSPGDVDRHHERLWDWRDTELSRCLTEAMK